MAEKKQMHWTQTPEGRRRLKAQTTANIEQRNRTRRRNQRLKAAAANGAVPPLRGRALARAEVDVLARRGAEVRLAEIEQEAVKLRIFIGKGGAS